MAFSRDSFDDAVQKALKEFNVSTIESLTPYQLKTLSAACTFLIGQDKNRRWNTPQHSHRLNTIDLQRL